MIFGAPKGQAHTKHVLWREDMLANADVRAQEWKIHLFLNGVERWVWWMGWVGGDGHSSHPGTGDVQNIDMVTQLHRVEAYRG